MGRACTFQGSAEAGGRCTRPELGKSLRGPDTRGGGRQRRKRDGSLSENMGGRGSTGGTDKLDGPHNQMNVRNGLILLINSVLQSAANRDSLLPARLTGGRGNDGFADDGPGAFVLRLLLGGPCPRRSSAPADRWRPRSRRCSPAAHTVLQPHGPALGRSRSDDPDAAGRLLLRHPLRAAFVRRGPPQSGLSLVLPAGPGEPNRSTRRQ